MIREKDIEKCSFFTTTGGDIWRIKKVKMVTEVELENCETARTETCRIGELSAERFVPIAMPRIVKVKATAKSTAKVEKKKGRPKKGVKKPTWKEPSVRVNNRGVRKGKKPLSGYLGVTVKQGKHGPRYYAQSNHGGEYKSLGGHNVEELAAAAVQDHIGNHEEAKRLRKIAREKTDAAIKELKGQAGQRYFLCNGCGADYEKKPENCVKCNGGSFEQIWRNAKAG